MFRLTTVEAVKEKSISPYGFDGRHNKRILLKLDSHLEASRGSAENFFWFDSGPVTNRSIDQNILVERKVVNYKSNSHCRKYGNIPSFLLRSK